MAYVLDPSGSVAREVRRVAGERLTEAITILDGLAVDADADADVDVDVERSVHDVRKRCKEVRSLARLVSSALGGEFDSFDRLVRRAADELAPFRDAHAVLATFDGLRSTHTDDPSLDHQRSFQAAVADAATDRIHGGDPRIQQARRLLAKARKRAERWRVDTGFGAVRTGIHDTYRRGRRNLRRAQKRPSDDQLHEWRKTVKHLWYQVRLVERAAPSVLEPLVASLDDLAEALGDDHDLAVLIERLRSDPDRFGGEHEVEHAVGVARSEQQELRRRAFRAGATIYAELPPAFAARIEAYWRNTADHGPELATGGIVDLAREEQRAGSVSPVSITTVERERKFLVADPPPLPAHGTTLRQGYLAIDRSVSVRVREADGEGCTLTLKAGRGAVRTELEWSITADEFAAAWEHTHDRRIHKTRYRLPLPDHVAEIDVFHDGLSGLVCAEVEFGDDESLADFEPPSWFGTEVTDDVAYTNASLAMHGLPSPPER